MSDKTPHSKRSDATKEKSAEIKRHLQGAQMNAELAEEIIAASREPAQRALYTERNERREQAMEDLKAELKDINKQ